MDDIRAIEALSVIIGDDALRERFLALTGFDGATLRARVGEADVAEAVRAFLAGHEPDLVRVAAALGESPDRLLGHVR